MHTLEWKTYFSIKISLKFVPKGPINNIPDGLAPTRQEAIIWTNDN